MMFPGEPSDSPMASTDVEGDRDSGGDLLPPGVDPAMVSEPSDGEQDRTEAGGHERTTSAGGICVIIEGNGESNGSLGDGLR